MHVQEKNPLTSVCLIGNKTNLDLSATNNGSGWNWPLFSFRRNSETEETGGVKTIPEASSDSIRLATEARESKLSLRSILDVAVVVVVASIVLIIYILSKLTC